MKHEIKHLCFQIHFTSLNRWFCLFMKNLWNIIYNHEYIWVVISDCSHRWIVNCLSWVLLISCLCCSLRMGKYKLIVGNPGDYNNWYRIAKSNSFCPIYDENETGSDEDIFIYESLNNIVRNAKGTGTNIHVYVK